MILSQMCRIKICIKRSHTDRIHHCEFNIPKIEMRISYLMKIRWNFYAHWAIAFNIQSHFLATARFFGKFILQTMSFWRLFVSLHSVPMLKYLKIPNKWNETNCCIYFCNRSFYCFVLFLFTLTFICEYSIQMLWANIISK